MTPAAVLADLIESQAVGLKAGTVGLAEYNPAWPALYTRVSDLLAANLRDIHCVIEHIGSTSVPGLPAKPILDIAIGASNPINTEVFTDHLAQAGFVFVADMGIYGGLFYTLGPDPELTVAHLHVVDIDDGQWRRYLAFRDGLRADAALKADYVALKRQAAASNAMDREGYTQAKFDWVLATARRLEGDPPTNHR